MEDEDVHRLGQLIDDLNQELQSMGLGLLEALDGDVHPDLTSDFLSKISQLQATLQVVEKHMGVKAANAVADASQLVEATVAVASPVRIGTGRRPRDPAFDYILLEGVNQAGRYQDMVGQDELLLLANSFLDKELKKNGLVAKLGRWKNNDRWLQWKHPYDLKLTEAGKLRREELLDYVKAKQLDGKVSDAFQDAWQHRMTPQ